MNDFQLEIKDEVVEEDSFLQGNALNNKGSSATVTFADISIIKDKRSSSLNDEGKNEVICSELSKLEKNGKSLNESNNSQSSNKKKKTEIKSKLIKNKTTSNKNLITYKTMAHFEIKKESNLKQNKIINPKKEKKVKIENPFGKRVDDTEIKFCKTESNINTMTNAKESSQKIFKNEKPEILETSEGLINSSGKSDESYQRISLNTQTNTKLGQNVSKVQPPMRFGKTMGRSAQSTTNLNKFLASTKIVKKIIPKSAQTKQGSPFSNLNKQEVKGFISEKIKDIFDKKFEESIDLMFNQLKLSQEQSQSAIHKDKDKLLETIQSLYEERIRKIKIASEKYEEDLSSLRGLIDYGNSFSVNNLIYESVLKDRNEEMKQIEEDFLTQKEEAFNLYGVKSRKSQANFERVTENQSEQIRRSLSNELKVKLLNIFKPFDSPSQFNYTAEKTQPDYDEENGMRHTISFKP